jgi:hypothetical protein
MPPKKRPARTRTGSVRFVVVYINRWGKKMDARDYGYKAWPFKRWK